MQNITKYNLSELRITNAMTQSEIAKRLDIGVSTYNMYENGLRSIPIDRAQQIATLLGVSIEDIFLPIKFTVGRSHIV